VVVGAVSGRPRELPDACALGPSAAVEIGRRYAEEIEPIDDSRGSAAYRRRVLGVEVRRAVEAVA
jgi:aerobic carbon-monoxide dehydrogenase medium subunit